MIDMIHTSSKIPKVIHIKKIEPFYNICKVSGVKEEINVEVEYVPADKLIELGSYRMFFKNSEFNMYIEDLADYVYSTLWALLEPRYLVVRIYLDEKKLTPWVVEINSSTMLRED